MPGGSVPLSSCVELGDYRYGLVPDQIWSGARSDAYNLSWFIGRSQNARDLLCVLIRRLADTRTWFSVGSHAYERLHGHAPSQMLADMVVSSNLMFSVFGCSSDRMVLPRWLCTEPHGFT